MKRTATVLACCLALAATASAEVDIPTWQVGDWWDVERAFTVTFNATSGTTVIAVSLNTTETYRLTVTDIADRQTTDGIVRAYRRERSNGTIDGQGTVSLGDLSFDLRWNPNTSTTSGTEWLAVGDLSRVGDAYTLNADLQAFVLIFWVKVATVELDANFDFSPTFEIHDFPLGTNGETWATTVTQQAAGHLRVQWEDTPLWGGSPPDDIDQPFYESSDINTVFSYEGREARGGFADTYRIDSQPAGSYWYEASIKDFVEMRPTDLDFGEFGGLTNLVVQVVDSDLGADAGFLIDRFQPERPYYSDRVELTGGAPEGTTITATILSEGTSTQTLAGAGDRYSLWLDAPGQDDNTPANDDIGSYGVEVMAEGIGRRLVTLRLFAPPSSSRPSWQYYR